MNRYLRSSITILLVVVLVLSLSGVAEDSTIVDNTFIVNETPSNEVEESPKEIRQSILMDDDVEVISNGNILPNAIPSKITIGVKEKYTIDTSGMCGKITYKSSKTKIATVSKKGIITGKKVGTAKITITPKKGKKKSITVIVKKAPSKVTLDETSLTLDVGEDEGLVATLPKNTASYSLTWTSSNKKVATVDEDGWVYAEGEGTAKITVKTFNGKKATCKVTVSDSRSYELRNYIGKSVDTLNNEIPDKLNYSNGKWENKYFSVEVDNGIITGIDISHSIPLSEGGAKYQLYILSPGMEFTDSNTRFLRLSLWYVEMSAGSGSLTTYLYKNDSYPSYTMLITVYNGIIRKIHLYKT